MYDIFHPNTIILSFYNTWTFPIWQHWTKPKIKIQLKQTHFQLKTDHV